jgi:hypothetical protein
VSTLRVAGVGVAGWANVGVARGSSRTLSANTLVRAQVANVERFIVTAFCERACALSGERASLLAGAEHK